MAKTSLDEKMIADGYVFLSEIEKAVDAQGKHKDPATHFIVKRFDFEKVKYRIVNDPEDKNHDETDKLYVDADYLNKALEITDGISY